MLRYNVTVYYKKANFKRFGLIIIISGKNNA